MPANTPTNWSDISGMQGNQTTQSNFNYSLPSFPMQGMYNTPGARPGGSSVLTSYDSYDDYLRAFQGAAGNPFANNRAIPVNQGPITGGSSLYSGPAAGLAANATWPSSSSSSTTLTPFTEADYLRAMEGQRIGSGGALRDAASSEDLDLYRSRLSSLLSDPSQIANDPNYQFLLNQGYGTLERQLGAQRMGNSGRALLEAQTFGQNTANTYLNSLANLYGGAAATEVASMQPRLGAEQNIFNTYWRNAPISASGGSSTSQGLSFTG